LQGARSRGLAGPAPDRDVPTGFKVRAAIDADAAPIAALSRELGYPAETKTIRERIARILARDDQRLLVAEGEGGEVLGWLQAHSSDILESGFRVEIIGMVVSEKMRRKGVGRGLVARAETWATEISAGTIVVRSNSKRVESHLFYPALGYLPSKTQVVYRKPTAI
jgi:GNAT superfamily N-acetyltransferase